MANFYQHIVIVHGIGREQLNETGVNFMNEFCRALPGNGELKVKNLVTRDTPFLIEGQSRAAYVIYELAGHTYYIGFSEVYWQPVTKGYLGSHDGNTPVPTFTWAHSINSRLLGERRAGQSLSEWRELIDNLETLLGLINTLATIYGKAKDFSEILADFLGDVQMYAEVDPIHDDVNGVFKAALDDIAVTRSQIEKHFESSRIYIVAHSEGTVVSWKSLMLAASQEAPPPWLQEVEGLVTFGSPIDKHHLFWGAQNFPANLAKKQPKKIPWWNFWDFSDPVGHSLEDIFGGSQRAEDHQFERVYDAGFARYPIPGLAHLGYWKDTNIYHRIIQEVMKIPAGYPPSQMDTGSRWWGNWTVMRIGDFVAYVVGRVLTIAAMLYFLNRLTTPLHGTLSHVAGWLFGFQSWGLAALVLALAGAWKFVWDTGLAGKQDAMLNLMAQYRVERVAMVVWAAILFVAALNIKIPATCPGDCATGGTYLEWAIGLFVTTIVWKAHTIVDKGLLQLWRYGKGGTPFQPPVPQAAVTAVSSR